MIYKRTTTHFFSESRLVYKMSDGFRFAPDELQQLNKQKEATEKELPVYKLVADSNRLFRLHDDRIKKLPKSFQSQLKQNIVQYLITSASRFDKDGEKGLDTNEFEKGYLPNMLKKIQEILDHYAPSKEQREKRKKQAEKLRQQSQKKEKLSNNERFNPQNLTTPRGIQTELVTYQKNLREIRHTVVAAQKEVASFQKKYKKFTKRKKGWGVFFRGLKFWGKDKETEKLRTAKKQMLQKLRLKVLRLQARQYAISEYGKKINASGDTLRNKKKSEYLKKKKQLSQRESTLSQQKLKNKEKYQMLSKQQRRLHEQRQKLLAQRSSLSNSQSRLQDRRQKSRLQRRKLGESHSMIRNAVQTIDQALQRGNLSQERRKVLVAERHKLMTRLAVLNSGMSAMQQQKVAASQSQQRLQQQQQNIARFLSNNQNHVQAVINPSLQSLQVSINAIGLEKQRHGTMQQRLLHEYTTSIGVIDRVDQHVANTVLRENLQTTQMLANLENQQHSLENLKISRPNVWTSTVGLLSHQIGKGWKLLTKDLLCGEILDPLSRWMKRVTKNIPVIGTITSFAANVLVDFPSGVLDGVGHMVHGLSTLIENPIQAVKGLGALIGRDPRTGKWSLATIKKSWLAMGKAMIAFDQFGKGNNAKALGHSAFMIFTMFANTFGAAGNAGKLAFQAARTAGRGVMFSTLKGAAVGIGTFAMEMGGTIARLPGNIIKSIGKILGSPVRLIEWLKMSRVERVGRMTEIISDGLRKIAVEIQESTVHGRLQNMSAAEVQGLTGRQLYELGIKTGSDIRSFMEYRHLLQQQEALQAASVSLRNALGASGDVTYATARQAFKHAQNRLGVQGLQKAQRPANSEGLYARLKQWMQRHADDSVSAAKHTNKRVYKPGFQGVADRVQDAVVEWWNRGSDAASAVTKEQTVHLNYGQQASIAADASTTVNLGYNNQGLTSAASDAAAGAADASTTVNLGYNNQPSASVASDAAAGAADATTVHLNYGQKPSASSVASDTAAAAANEGSTTVRLNYNQQQASAAADTAAFSSSPQLTTTSDLAPYTLENMATKMVDGHCAPGSITFAMRSRLPSGEFLKVLNQARQDVQAFLADLRASGVPQQQQLAQALEYQLSKVSGVARENLEIVYSLRIRYKNPRGIPPTSKLAWPETNTATIESFWKASEIHINRTVQHLFRESGVTATGFQLEQVATNANAALKLLQEGKTVLVETYRHVQSFVMKDGKIYEMNIFNRKVIPRTLQEFQQFVSNQAQRVSGMKFSSSSGSSSGMTINLGY